LQRIILFTLTINITLNSLSFKSGGWLKYHVYDISKVKYYLDLLSGVKIISDEDVVNEIDIIFTKDK